MDDMFGFVCKSILIKRQLLSSSTNQKHKLV